MQKKRKNFIFWQKWDFIHFAWGFLQHKRNSDSFRINNVNAPWELNCNISLKSPNPLRNAINTIYTILTFFGFREMPFRVWNGATVRFWNDTCKYILEITRLWFISENRMIYFQIERGLWLYWDGFSKISSFFGFL